MSLLVASLLYLALLLLLAVISATETAIHSARDTEAQLLAAGEGAVARKLRAITANPFTQLHRTLVLSAALNLALAALGLWIVIGPLRAMGWNAWITSSVLFLATVLLGDMAPKFFAARNPSVVLLGSLRLLHPLRNVLDPLASLVDRTTDLLLRKFVTRHMRDCMIPRVDLALMSSEDSPQKTTAILEKAASRFVIVYGETPDSVEGVIDTNAWKLANRPEWSTLLHAPAFVPETMPVLEALEHHLQSNEQPVLIADEYGGLEGMITRREIADWLLYEAAPWHGENSEIRDLGNGRFLLDGGTRLDHLKKELDVDLNIEDLDVAGIDTIGGLVFNQLGHVPKPGERISIDTTDIKVRRIVRARIQEVELRLKPKPAEDSAAA